VSISIITTIGQHVRITYIRPTGSGVIRPCCPNGECVDLSGPRSSVLSIGELK
jgi:hypothetical protein